jgi:hypothetical protein
MLYSKTTFHQTQIYLIDCTIADFCFKRAGKSPHGKKDLILQAKNVFMRRKFPIKSVRFFT